MYVDRLKEELVWMGERKAFLEGELKRLPKGRLCGRKRKNGVSFVWEIRKKGERMRMTVGEKEWVVNELIRREFFEREYGDLERNMKLLAGAVARMSECERSEVAGELMGRVKGIGGDRIARALAEKEEEWANEPYERLLFREEDKRHITSRGLMVRSKSELTIAELFYRYEIAFRYEAVLRLGERTFAPDFTIRRRDGKILYWEHLGMMTDEEYARRQFEKIRLYAHYGITLWNNLIFSFDDAEGNLDLRRVKAEIEARISM